MTVCTRVLFEHAFIVFSQEIPLPRKPRANEVVVKMKALGICGSDVHVSLCLNSACGVRV